MTIGKNLALGFLFTYSILILSGCDPTYSCSIVNKNDFAIEVVLSSFQNSNYMIVDKKDTSQIRGIENENTLEHLDTSRYFIRDNQEEKRLLVRSDTFRLEPDSSAYVGGGFLKHCEEPYHYNRLECNSLDRKRTLTLSDEAYTGEFHKSDCVNCVFEIEF